MRISDWSSDVCSSDLFERIIVPDHDVAGAARAQRPDAALHADGARGYAADRGEGLIPAQPARARHARQPDEVARISRRIAHLVRVIIVEPADRHIDPRGLEPPRVRLPRPASIRTAPCRESVCQYV